MTKNLSLLAAFLACNIFADSFYYNTPNVHGSLGVINVPSARFYEEPAGVLSLYRGLPDRKVTLTLYPYEWLEASLFYSSIKDKPYGSGFKQDYKDKGFNVKVRLKEQDQFPAIAIGINDLGGTGYYSGEYLVSSYSKDYFDIHLGLGWGNLNHHKHFKNPLTIISKSFETRDFSSKNGGRLSVDNFFSGSDLSLFGGINYLFNDNLVLKLEYDPTTTPGNIGYEERDSDVSFGLSFLNQNYIVGLNLERGSAITLNFSMRDNFFIPEYIYKNNITKEKNPHKNLIKILEMNSVGVSKIKKRDSKVALSLTQNKHKYQKLKDIVDSAIIDSGLTEEVLVTYRIAGLDVIENDEHFRDSKIVYENKYKGWNDNFSINIRPFLAAREDFLKAAVLLEHDSELIFSENFFFSTNLKLSIIDNFDDLIYPPVDVYPAQVRSDVKKYLNNLGDKLSIGRAQFEYFKTLSNRNHILLSAGIYEEMFSGYGFEYLNYDPARRINWGYEAYKVYKRDYNFGFGVLGYSNITQHANLYLKSREFIPFDLKFSFGEYLAGDKGYTVEFSRSFKSGIKMGFFASFTDVSFDQFGEGSFDKGIFFTIPFGSSRKMSNFVWRPLTKDPASKLITKNNIYDLVDRYSILP